MDYSNQLPLLTRSGDIGRVDTSPVIKQASTPGMSPADLYRGSQPANMNLMIQEFKADAAMFEPNISNSRVCERCIGRKVKCDQRRPSCSRCSEVGHECKYSFVKRRPGPPQGSRHKKRALADTSQGPSHTLDSQTSSPSDVIDVNDSKLVKLDNDILNSDYFNGIPYGLALFPGQEQLLLNYFFSFIHPSIPLLDQDVFFMLYEIGAITPDLLTTMCAIALALSPSVSESNTQMVENTLKRLMDNSILKTDSDTNPPPLESFQQACMLAYYCFHQYPGQDSWLKIGSLCRKAYRWGLHEIDSDIQPSQIVSRSVNEIDIHGWRRVWWFIFGLDSYSNITAETPFILETETISTALFQGQKDDLTGDIKPLFLGDTTVLWKIVRASFHDSGQADKNMHIIATTLLKEAGNLNRLQRKAATKSIYIRIDQLENDISAVRLALPASYSNTRRNSETNESITEYHARIISNLQLYCAELLLAISFDNSEADDVFEERTRRMLKYCESIVTVIKEWDDQNFLSFDPAICFIAYLVLIVVGLLKSNYELDSAVVASMRQNQLVIVLFLDQFASFWQLPKYLRALARMLATTAKPCLTQTEVRLTFKEFKAPLHQQWSSLFIESKR